MTSSQATTLDTYQELVRERYADTVGAQLASWQLDVARFYGAESMVPVSAAHLMGDMEVLGASGRDLFLQCATEQLRVSVPTTTNARCVDFAAADRLRQDTELVTNEHGLRNTLARLGILLTDTCTNYQTVHQPHFREHVAWGDTGAVIYANSVLGARTNFESGPAALAAALTGFTPRYGHHLDAHRRGTHLFDVTAPLDDVADWGALGAVVGQQVPGYWTVPVFRLQDQTPTADRMKHLGASLASHGSHAMFHLVGATPEAPTVTDATHDGRLTPRHVTADDLTRAYDAASDGADARADVVAFTAPHLSLFELRQLVELLDGRATSSDVTVIVTTSSQTRDEARRLGIVDELEQAGVLVLSGVCLYLMALGTMASKLGWRTLVTNSAKLANIVGGYRLRGVLASTPHAIEAAVTGQVDGRGTS